MPPTSGGRQVVARNKKARHLYEVLDSWEAGLVLRGTEIKSVREGKVAFQDCHARPEAGEMWLHNLYIAPYQGRQPVESRRGPPQKTASAQGSDPAGYSQVEEKGLALVPLDIYLRRGRAKVTLGLCRGKKHRDRREELRRATLDREAERAMKGIW